VKLVIAVNPKAPPFDHRPAAPLVPNTVAVALAGDPLEIVAFALPVAVALRTRVVREEEKGALVNGVVVSLMTVVARAIRPVAVAVGVTVTLWGSASLR